MSANTSESGPARRAERTRAAAEEHEMKIYERVKARLAAGD